MSILFYKNICIMIRNSVIIRLRGDILKTGEKIKQIRTKKKITQKQLAEMINRNIRTVQKYESGEIEIPLESLFKLSEVLGVSVTYLDESKLENTNLYMNKLVSPYISNINNDNSIDNELKSRVNEMNNFFADFDNTISRLEKYRMSKSDMESLNVFKKLAIIGKEAFLENLEEENYFYQIGYLNALVNNMKFIMQGLEELLENYE